MDELILARRKEVYLEARTRHPERWSGDIRDWDLPEEVWLNPTKEKSASENDKAKVA